MKAETIGVLARLLGANVTGLARNGDRGSDSERFGLEVLMSDGTYKVLWVDGDVLSLQEVKPGEYR